MYRILFVLSFTLLLPGCENHNFDRDKRQLIAKDAIRSKLPHASTNFDIINYKEDTLNNWTDTTIKRPIRYTLDVVYTDSTGVVQHRTGFVLFTPDGRSMIRAEVDAQNR